MFFRTQDALTNDIQKQLIHRLGQLAGKPETSTLHVHPVLNTQDDVGEKRESDKEVSTISSKLFKKLYGGANKDTLSQKKQSAFNWHADISFEPVPADYTSLRLTELPSTGGGVYSMRVLTPTDICRYTMGVWLRALRSHFQAISEVPRDLNRHICTTILPAGS